MAELNYTAKIIPDVEGLRKSIESQLKDVSFSLGGFSAVKRQIEEQLIPNISFKPAKLASIKSEMGQYFTENPVSISFKPVRLASLNKAIREGLGEIPVSFKADIKGIESQLSGIGGKSISVNIDIKDIKPQISGLNKALTEVEDSFGKASAAKDRFAANVAEKFPAIVAQINEVTQALRGMRGELNTPIKVAAAPQQQATQQPQASVAVSRDEVRDSPDYRAAQLNASRYKQELFGVQAQTKRQSAEIEKLNSQIQGNTAQTAKASEEQVNFGRNVGFTTRRLAAYSLAATGIFQLIRGFQVAVSQVTEINRDLIQLQQILGDQGSNYSKIADDVFKIAVNYGQSATEILKVTKTLAQAGDVFGRSTSNLVGAVEALSKTNLAATFGNIEETTQGAIAYINQFNLAGTDLIKILDSANTLSRDFAAEAGDLFKAVQTGGAAFAAFGGNVKDFQALVTGIRSITRLSANTIGTGLNSIIPTVFSPKNLQLIRDLGIQVNDATGNFRPFVDILRDISVAYNKASDEQKVFLSESLFGKRQAKIGTGVLKDLGLGENSTINKAVKAARDSTGSLNQDAIKGLQRFDVQLQRVGARFQEIFRAVAEDESFQRFVKEIIGGLHTVVDLLDSVKGLLPSLLRIGTGALLGLGANQIGGFIQGVRDRSRNQIGISPGSLSSLTPPPSRPSGGRPIGIRPIGPIGPTTGFLNLTQESDRLSEFLGGGAVGPRGFGKNQTGLHGAVSVVSQGVESAIKKFPGIQQVFQRNPLSVQLRNAAEFQQEILLPSGMRGRENVYGAYHPRSQFAELATKGLSPTTALHEVGHHIFEAGLSKEEQQKFTQLYSGLPGAATGRQVPYFAKEAFGEAFAKSTLGPQFSSRHNLANDPRLAAIFSGENLHPDIEQFLQGQFGGSPALGTPSRGRFKLTGKPSVDYFTILQDFVNKADGDRERGEKNLIGHLQRTVSKKGPLSGPYGRILGYQERQNRSPQYYEPYAENPEAVFDKIVGRLGVQRGIEHIQGVASANRKNSLRYQDVLNRVLVPEQTSITPLVGASPLYNPDLHRARRTAEDYASFAELPPLQASGGRLRYRLTTDPEEIKKANQYFPELNSLTSRTFEERRNSEASKRSKPGNYYDQISASQDLSKVTRTLTSEFGGLIRVLGRILTSVGNVTAGPRSNLAGQFRNELAGARKTLGAFEDVPLGTPAGYGSIEGSNSPFRANPLRNTNRSPLPLPDLGGVSSSQVERAFNIVSSRHPKLAGLIKGFGEFNPQQTPEGVNAFFHQDSGRIAIRPGSTLQPSTLFHELTHVAQKARGNLKSRTALTDEEYMAIEGAAHNRGNLAKVLDSTTEIIPFAPPSSVNKRIRAQNIGATDADRNRKNREYELAQELEQEEKVFKSALKGLQKFTPTEETRRGVGFLQEQVFKTGTQLDLLTSRNYLQQGVFGHQPTQHRIPLANINPAVDPLGVLPPGLRFLSGTLNTKLRGNTLGPGISAGGQTPFTAEERQLTGRRSKLVEYLQVLENDVAQKLKDPKSVGRSFDSLNNAIKQHAEEIDRVTKQIRGLGIESGAIPVEPIFDKRSRSQIVADKEDQRKFIEAKRAFRDYESGGSDINRDPDVIRGVREFRKSRGLGASPPPDITYVGEKIPERPPYDPYRVSPGRLNSYYGGSSPFERDIPLQFGAIGRTPRSTDIKTVINKILDLSVTDAINGVANKVRQSQPFNGAIRVNDPNRGVSFAVPPSFAGNPSSRREAERQAKDQADQQRRFNLTQNRIEQRSIEESLFNIQGAKLDIENQLKKPTVERDRIQEIISGATTKRDKGIASIDPLSSENQQLKERQRLTNEFNQSLRDANINSARVAEANEKFAKASNHAAAEMDRLGKQEQELIAELSRVQNRDIGKSISNAGEAQQGSFLSRTGRFARGVGSRLAGGLPFVAPLLLDFAAQQIKDEPLNIRQGGLGGGFDDRTRANRQSGALRGALSGASVGATTGFFGFGPIGAAVGGGIGAIAGALLSFNQAVKDTKDALLGAAAAGKTFNQNLSPLVKSVLINNAEGGGRSDRYLRKLSGSDPATQAARQILQGRVETFAQERGASYGRDPARFRKDLQEFLRKEVTASVEEAGKSLTPGQREKEINDLARDLGRKFSEAGNTAFKAASNLKLLNNATEELGTAFQKLLRNINESNQNLNYQVSSRRFQTQSRQDILGLLNGQQSQFPLEQFGNTLIDRFKILADRGEVTNENSAALTGGLLSPRELAGVAETSKLSKDLDDLFRSFISRSSQTDLDESKKSELANQFETEIGGIFEKSDYRNVASSEIKELFKAVRKQAEELARGGAESFKGKKAEDLRDSVLKGFDLVGPAAEKAAARLALLVDNLDRTRQAYEVQRRYLDQIADANQKQISNTLEYVDRQRALGSSTEDTLKAIDQVIAGLTKPDLSADVANIAKSQNRVVNTQRPLQEILGAGGQNLGGAAANAQIQQVLKGGLNVNQGKALRQNLGLDTRQFDTLTDIQSKIKQVGAKGLPNLDKDFLKASGIDALEDLNFNTVKEFEDYRNSIDKALSGQVAVVKDTQQLIAAKESQLKEFKIPTIDVADIPFEKLGQSGANRTQSNDELRERIRKSYEGRRENLRQEIDSLKTNKLPQDIRGQEKLAKEAERLKNVSPGIAQNPKYEDRLNTALQKRIDQENASILTGSQFTSLIEDNNRAILESQEAQDKYGRSLIQLQTYSNALGNKFSELSNKLSQTLQTGRNIGQSSLTDTVQAQIGLSQANSLGLVGGLGGITDVKGLATADTQKLTDLSRQLALVPDAIFNNITQGAKLYGNRPVGPSGVTGENFADIITILRGQGRLGNPEENVRNLQKQQQNAIKAADDLYKLQQDQTNATIQTAQNTATIAAILLKAFPQATPPATQPAAVSQQIQTPNVQAPPVATQPSSLPPSPPILTPISSPPVPVLKGLGGKDPLSKNIDTLVDVGNEFSSSNKELQLRIGKLVDLIADLQTARSQGKTGSEAHINTNLVVTGFENVGKDIAYSAIIVAILNNIIKQLNNNDPAEARMRQIFTDVIRQIDIGRGK